MFGRYTSKQFVRATTPSRHRMLGVAISCDRAVWDGSDLPLPKRLLRFANSFISSFHDFSNLLVGTTSTVQVAWRTTLSETLFVSKRPSQFRLWDPRIIRSADHSLATLRITTPGSPRLSIVSGLNPAVRSSLATPATTLVLAFFVSFA